ncbi:MAG: hypothetical protein GY821_14830 [Gammaproteobacteria bacterium]|nr:hypothetical protein [Gammaproteobacteria bacterium]
MNCVRNDCELVLEIKKTGAVLSKYNITMTNTMKNITLKPNGISHQNGLIDETKKIQVPNSAIAIESRIKNGNIERQGIIAYDSFSCDLVAGKNKFSSNSLAPYIQENSDPYVSTSNPKYFKKSAFSRVFTTFDGWKGGLAGMALAGITTGGLTYFGIIGAAISAIAFPPLAVAIVGGIIIAAASYFLGKWLLPKLWEKIKCCIPCCGKNDDIDGKIDSIEKNDELHNDKHLRHTIINNEENGYNKSKIEYNNSLIGTNSFHNENKVISENDSEKQRLIIKTKDDGEYNSLNSHT